MSYLETEAEMVGWFFEETGFLLIHSELFINAM